MTEEKNITTNEANTSTNADLDYKKNFMPAVHRIGRSTMALAFIFSFLPVAYFIVVRGFGLPVSQYVKVATAICSLGIGMWISEPIAYWPVLGSAGTYIAYLSGNVGAMRFPVALSVQSNMKADINTPRGQIITIVGIVSSVVANLILLLVIVFGGQWLISVLPDVVMGAFSFVMVTLYGAMWMMRFDGKDGVVKGFLSNLPYLALAIVCYKVLTISPLVDWGMLVTVVACIALAYVLYRRDLKKAEEAGE
jgi:hypothetical protein